jgi:dienelactone hydrolase
VSKISFYPETRSAPKSAACFSARASAPASRSDGFFADYRPSYNRADAEASWSEAKRWLETHGV